MCWSSFSLRCEVSACFIHCALSWTSWFITFALLVGSPPMTRRRRRSSRMASTTRFQVRAGPGTGFLSWFLRFDVGIRAHAMLHIFACRISCMSNCISTQPFVRTRCCKFLHVELHFDVAICQHKFCGSVGCRQSIS